MFSGAASVKTQHGGNGCLRKTVCVEGGFKIARMIWTGIGRNNASSEAQDQAGADLACKLRKHFVAWGVAVWACLGMWEAAAQPQAHSSLRVMEAMEDGLWRETLESSWQESVRTDVCTSSKDMDDYLLSLQLQDGHCSSGLVSNEATRAELHMHCAPLGSVEALGVLEVTSVSPQAYRVSLRMHNPTNDSKAHMTQYFERLGSCEK